MTCCSLIAAGRAADFNLVTNAPAIIVPDGKSPNQKFNLYLNYKICVAKKVQTTEERREARKIGSVVDLLIDGIRVIRI